MVFPVVGGDGKPTGYEIDNSLRFEDGDAPRLTKTFSSSGNRRTVTFSAWFKLSNLGIIRHIFSNNGADFINLESDNTLSVQLAGSAEGYLYSNRVFRDPSAWYHIVVAVDTTQGTASNRLKLYINGVQETSFSDSSNPNQNLETGFAENVQHAIGMRSANVDRHFDGYLAEVNFVDGSALDPTYFGETDDNGVWIPKKPDVSSYGTNGFYMQFQQTGTSANSSGIGADTSGNDHHFAVTNLAATDVTEDTPTNNFCTLSSVDNDGVVLSEGNCNFDTSSGNNEGVRGTIGVQNGKWYYECKITGSAGMSAGNIGYSRPEVPVTSGPASVLGLFANGSSTFGLYNNSSGKTSLDASAGIGQNDIIGVALDLDSSTKTIAYYRNGSIMGSAQTINASILGDFLLPVMLDDGGVNDVVGSFNFGNPTFSISSGNTDGKYGNFEYAPPSGYYALCTKRLADHG